MRTKRLSAAPLLVTGPVATGAWALLGSARAFAAPLLGQPTPYGITLQPAGDSIRRSATFFHDAILLPVIVVISLFVLALLLCVVVFFNRKRNPTPARFAHNTPLEVAWTVAPVLVLMFIAIFSFRLLYAYHDAPRADLTVKATGNQWYWAYEYPDQKIAEYTSNILPQEQAKARGVPYKLAVTNPLVVPVGKVTKVLVTGADVLHAFFVPAFGVQTTAVPGRVNEVWFKPERTGVYYGQCNELCGVDHAFMPIEVDAVDQASFDRWVARHAAKTAAPVTVTPVTVAPVTVGSGPTAVPVSNPGVANQGTDGPVGGSATPASGTAPPPAAQTHPHGPAGAAPPSHT